MCQVYLHPWHKYHRKAEPGGSRSIDWLPQRGHGWDSDGLEAITL
jgi:hypothetical protein